MAKMSDAHDVLIRKLQAHSTLSGADMTAIRALPDSKRMLAPNADVVRQGDKPNVSAVVLSEMVARYHTLATGQRQYLSFHIVGDMPDSQTLFIDTMDHGVCAIDDGVVSLIPHEALLSLFKERPS